MKRPASSKLALALALFSTWLLGEHLLFGQSHTWRLLGIAPGPVPFFDTHNVLAALDCAREGLDPLSANPCDAEQRPMNYPRLWLSLAGTGIGRGDETWIGIGTALATLATVLGLARSAHRGQWLVWLAAVASPAVQFGVSRGNTDLWIFAALVVAIRARRALPTACAAAWALVSALKLYPVVAAIAWHRAPTRAPAARYFAGVLLLYWAVSYRDLWLIADALPIRGALTYGAANLGQLLGMAVAGTKLSGTAVANSGLAGRLGVAALLAWTVVAHRTATPSAESPPVVAPGHEEPSAQQQRPQWTQEAFHSGAAIYIATYALGSNWNYRMIFLLLLLPHLLCHPLEWGKPYQTGLFASSGWLVVLTLATLWTSGYPRFYLLYVDEWLALGLALTLCAHLSRDLSGRRCRSTHGQLLARDQPKAHPQLAQSIHVKVQAND